MLRRSPVCSECRAVLDNYDHKMGCASGRDTPRRVRITPEQFKAEHPEACATFFEDTRGTQIHLSEFEIYVRPGGGVNLYWEHDPWFWDGERWWT